MNATKANQFRSKSPVDYAVNLAACHVFGMELFVTDLVGRRSPVHRDPGGVTLMSLGTILVILLVLVLLGVIPSWGYSNSWGYGPSGIVGTILVIVLILALLGRI
jgi:hypothetical protein